MDRPLVMFAANLLAVFGGFAQSAYDKHVVTDTGNTTGEAVRPVVFAEPRVGNIDRFPFQSSKALLGHVVDALPNISRAHST